MTVRKCSLRTTRRTLLCAAAAAAFLFSATPFAPSAAQDATSLESDRETLRAVSLLYRHGVISPKYSPPKNATEWPMGFSQLTAVGMRGMYEQGQRLRKRYVEDLGLISERYHTDEVHVRASNTDRALQSAQMMILGLYPLGMGPDPSVYLSDMEAAPGPELAFTPVPIHAVALENDAVMRPWTGRADCTRYRNFVKRLGNTELYETQGRKYEDFLRRVSAVMGVNEGERIGRMLYLVNEVYEPLSANLQHNLPLPEGISVADMEQMSALADWNYHHQFLGRSVGRLTGGSFVGEVLKNFAKVAENKPDAKRLYLYSGHQRTMLGVDAALSIETARTEGPLFTGRVPPLGSHYAFELHETAPGDFAVRMKFVTDESEQVIPIPGCDSPMCQLKTFASAVADVIPRNWRQECNG
ncbi:histidine phosphatase family protein [Pelagibius sp.]|uniref:histidine phosphatase family protein n=1 Tax=Pelagibius sp. TaxID=1931238 RepID=UPI003B509063